MVARVREQKDRQTDSQRGRHTERQTVRGRDRELKKVGEKGVWRRVEQKEKENKRLVHDVTASIRPD